MAKKQVRATKVFYSNWEALGAGKRYIVNEGGSRSSKTYSIMQMLIMYATKTSDTSITVTSRSLPALKKGALRDFENIMKRDLRWYTDKFHNKTDQIYNFPNGSYIEFFGLEEADKAKGPGRKILFVNEANLIGKDVFDQLDMRTEWLVILDLNPSDFDCWCYGVADGPDAVKIHSTYMDNPALPLQQVKVIEGYRRADPDGLMWKVFGLGQRGASEDQIYTHFRTVPTMPGKGERWYGIDFGFTVPTAMVEVELYEDAIYAREVLYRTQMTTQDRIGFVKGLGIGKAEIYADAAEPATIEEMYRAGINVKPAEKDVWAGILKVKSLPLYITEDSVNLRKELASYKWKRDKNDKILEEPVKENDHLCDALRYAVYTRLNRPKMTWVAI